MEQSFSRHFICIKVQHFRSGSVMTPKLTCRGWWPGGECLVWGAGWGQHSPHLSCGCPPVLSEGTAGGTANIPHSQELADVSDPEGQCWGTGPEMQPVHWWTVSQGPRCPELLVSEGVGVCHPLPPWLLCVSSLCVPWASPNLCPHPVHRV